MTEFSISVQTAKIYIILRYLTSFLRLYLQENRNFSWLCSQRSSVDMRSENSKNLRYILFEIKHFEVCMRIQFISTDFLHKI